MAFENYVEMLLDADTYRGREYIVEVFELVKDKPPELLGYVNSDRRFVPRHGFDVDCLLNREAALGSLAGAVSNTPRASKNAILHRESRPVSWKLIIEEVPPRDAFIRSLTPLQRVNYLALHPDEPKGD